MELTICSPQLGISLESNSGGEVYDRELLRQLCLLDLKILVLLPKNRSYPSENNLKVLYLPIKSIYPPYFFNFFVFPYLFKTYIKYRFNILRVHNPYFVGPAALLFKKFYPRIPIIANYHHLEESNKLQTILDKSFIHDFDHIIAVSQFTKEEIIRKYNMPSLKITVIYQGIEKKFSPRKKKELLINKYGLRGKKIILFLGGLKERKNPLFLLDIIKNLKVENVKFLIAGEGPLKNEMIAKTQQLGLRKYVEFAGFVKENQKIDFYNLADLVLLPSKKEGFGRIAAEAGACGKSVIASNNSSLPEVIVDKKTGFLAKTNSISDWVNKINLVLDDKDLKEKMEQEAIKYIKNKFSWEKNARIHLEIFKKLLKNNEDTFC